MNSTESIVALPPPPGVTSNFVDPPFNGERIIIVGILFPILTIPFLAARFYAKAFLIRKLQLDDCTFHQKSAQQQDFMLIKL
jgi:hypothetical protein